MNIVTDNSAVITALKERIAELEKQLKPDIFWPSSGAEFGFNTEDEAIESIFDEENAKVGSVFTLDMATKLPSKNYVIISFHNHTGDFDWEEIKDPS